MPDGKFEIAVIGLGLMGGSLAYALNGFRNCAITGYDTDAATLDAALERGAVGNAASSPREAVENADLTIFCSGPASIIDNIGASLGFFKEGSVITDICGVKRDILAFVQKHLPPGLDYVGLHPMAGKEVGGFVNADPAIFKGAGFIIVLPEKYAQSSVSLLEELCRHIGAGRIVTNRSGEHDRIIAYTSDLMHISATALCADYPESMTMAHTAGAFRDCTRIADIDAALWTELLTKNSENIIPHLKGYISALSALEKALEEDDRTYIHNFLQKAADNKRKMLTL